ncbi:MAG: isoprenyl transferase [Desulfovibrio sp.]
MIPQHIAVIMDGNGRWAQARGLSRSEGHKAGTETARTLVSHCRKLGVKYLTLYTFSKENWARPKDEVSTLFNLLIKFLGNEVGQLKKQDIKLNVLGDVQGLPFAVRQAIKHACTKTADCKAMTLNLALNYSGRDEILHAVKSIVEQGIATEDITEETFADALYSAKQPDPDYIIRTSGELRLSNFLLYQAAYSEFYFTDVAWPDFSPEELDKALDDYNNRQRRYGKTGEQVK